MEKRISLLQPRLFHSPTLCAKHPFSLACWLQGQLRRHVPHVRLWPPTLCIFPRFLFPHFLGIPLLWGYWEAVYSKYYPHVPWGHSWQIPARRNPNELSRKEPKDPGAWRFAVWHEQLIASWLLRPEIVRFSDLRTGGHIISQRSAWCWGSTRSRCIGLTEGYEGPLIRS